jgi:hypothetical protein
MKVLLFLVVMAAVVWALMEILQTDSRDIRRLSKPLWILIVVVLTLPGALAWFLIGRPRVPVGTPGSAGPQNNGPRTRPSPRGYVSRPAPDDDPEFLHRLSQQAEHQKMLRRLEQDFDAGKTGDAKSADKATDTSTDEADPPEDPRD